MMKNFTHLSLISLLLLAAGCKKTAQKDPEVDNLFTFTIPLDVAGEIDSAVIILTKGGKKIVEEFEIDAKSAKAIIPEIALGKWETEVRTFKTASIASSTWYNKPSWEISGQVNINNARYASRLKQTTTVSGSSLNVIFPSVKNKNIWVDYYYNSLKEGILLFFSQNLWGTFLEVEVPDRLTLDAVHVDKTVFWVALDGSAHTNQSNTIWDMCNDKNTCSYELPQNKHSFFFQLNKGAVLNEISCHDTFVYISCHNTITNTNMEDFKTFVICTDKN